MDACAKVKRCKEEAVFLREEARDALIYYQRQEHNLASAVRAREDSEDPVARSHKLLLERELSKVQRLKARMLQTQAYLNTLFGELPGAHQEGAAMEGDVPESAPTGEADLGADPEVFPESQDADYEGTDYDDDEEEEEGRRATRRRTSHPRRATPATLASVAVTCLGVMCGSGSDFHAASGPMGNRTSNATAVPGHTGCP